MSAQEYFDFDRGEQHIDVLGQQLSPLPVRFSDGYIADSGSMRIRSRCLRTSY
jgi:hypothetical protein